MKLVLASKSPRRAELLAAAGIEFTVRVTDIDETPRECEAARDYVLRVAGEKARAVKTEPGEIVLAADTTVVLDGQILGKPADAADAVRMLRALAGRRHEVMTGICLRQGDRVLTDCAATAVWFHPLAQAEIEDYVASGEPMDKAGAYGIQGLASRFIERIEGSYSNVVGLPVALVWR
ncbi:MAG: Maf family protein [Acidobacteriota bacterium]|nr:Maf family protein [Acidobacteriota bacterium]